MGKSKFQVNVKNKVDNKSKIKRKTPKYYDEHMINKQSSKSNAGFGFFVIFCLIIGGTVSGVLIYNNIEEDPNGNGTDSGIQDGDEIVLKYTFYIDWNNNLEFEGTELAMDEDDFHWTVAKVTDDDFPPGFYINILGMKVGEDKDIILPPNIDTDDDGIDDLTGKPVESYGSGTFANKALKFSVLVKSIN